MGGLRSAPTRGEAAGAPHAPLGPFCCLAPPFRLPASCLQVTGGRPLVQHAFTCDNLFPLLSTGHERAGPGCSRLAQRVARSSGLLSVCRKRAQALPRPPNPIDAAPDPLLPPRTLRFLPAWAPPRLPGPPVTPASPPHPQRKAWARPLPPVPAVLHSNPRLQRLPGRPRLWVSVPTARPAWRAPLRPVYRTSHCSHRSLSSEATASGKPSVSRLCPSTLLIHFPVRPLHWPHAPGGENQVWVAPLLSLQDLVAAPRLAAAPGWLVLRGQGTAGCTLAVTSQGGRRPLSSWRPRLPSPAPPLPATWAGCPPSS